MAQAESGAPGEVILTANLGSAFTYQGRLHHDGTPVNGVCDTQFSLWDNATGGAQIGSTQTSTVTVTGGLFTVPALDFGSTAFTGQSRWLEVAVRCPSGSGSFTTLTPRQALTATPYALSLRPGAEVTGNVSGSSLLAWNTTTTGLSYGLYGRSDSNGGRGIAGFASSGSGDAVGVYGLSASSNGSGVTGEATAVTGPTIGVYGVTRSASENAAGVLGEAARTSVLQNTIGVRGINRNNTPAGVGVRGDHLDSGIGVLGSSARGVGVFGDVISNTLGVGVGVWGRTAYQNGTGVVGEATSSSGTTYGVRGFVTSPNGYAGFFSGGQGVRVDGNLQATGVKTFVIDHPLDPANKYLYHFAQEGPAIQNVYNGIITLDDTGSATVTLPDYFAAINTGPFLYQLTPIGAAMPNLHIAQTIEHNQFRIAGGVSGAQVSWEVTATRNDPYLRAHPVATEVNKPTNERGFYLAPEAYGLPETLRAHSVPTLSPPRFAEEEQR